MRYHRHSAAVIGTRRWKALRLQTLRRDGWKCVGVLPDGTACGASGRLEIDHVKPVRTHPDLAFELDNLQTLCRRCHAAKTRREVFGGAPPSPERVAWLRLLRVEKL